MVLEKTIESPLDCKEIQPVNPKKKKKKERKKERKEKKKRKISPEYSLEGLMLNLKL